ncbi:hypothetical protein SE17_33115, partial [Kouleothrix aurantiaca]
AGAAIMPMMLSWVLASIVGSRLLLNVGYRTLSVFGMVLFVIGALALTQSGGAFGTTLLLGSMALMGVGMGLSIPSFLIAVQSTVQRSALGTATSTLQFSRSIGGTLGVSIMGALLSAQLAAGLLAAGLDPASVSLSALLDPIAQANSAALDGTLRTVLARAILGVFWLAFGAAVLGLAATLLAPAVQLGKRAVSQTVGEGEAITPPLPVGE